MTILFNFQNLVQQPLHSICLQTHLAKVLCFHLVALTKMERKERPGAMRNYMQNSYLQHWKCHFLVSAEGLTCSEISFFKEDHLYVN